MNNSQLVAESIVFIESNTTGTGHLFLKKAIEKNYRIIFITADPEKYPFLATELIQPVILNTLDEGKMYDYLSNIAGLAGIFSTSEYYIEIAAVLAQKFNFPSNTPESIKTCRNKDLLAQRLQENQLNCPKTVIIYSLEEAKNNNNVQFPVIVKPAKGSGSIGVKLCVNHNEYLDHIAYQLNECCEKAVLVQEYIMGEEYSVESLGIHHRIEIIGITQKHLGELPYFLETGHDFPAKLSASLTQKIHQLVTHALEKTGLIFGPSHSELRVKNGEPYMIEINPRLAGGMIPQIIKEATNIDLIDITIDLIVGKNNTKIPEKLKQYASIRFIIPSISGQLITVEWPQEKPDELVDIHITRPMNEVITLQGDFRDRIGFIIACADCLEKAQTITDQFMRSIRVHSQPIQNLLNNTGRLKETLLQEAQELLEPISDNTHNRVEEFRYLTDIDEAHLLMLHKQAIISTDTLKALLEKIQALRAEKFVTLNNKPAPRGLYLLYENELIHALGIDIAGRTHIARSRNDINATVCQLKLRAVYFNIYAALWRLRSTLTNQAQLHAKTLFPLYSQYQTALPGTLGYYFLAIFSALSRDQHTLQSLFSALDVCPLGAGAGGGTSFPIDSNYTATLLGFSRAAFNALDAVASRDMVLRLLSLMVIIGMTLSRLTEDMQLWSTNEFRLIDFPDSLTGGSSMMPQKKNPYLLEKIKGRLSALLGCFTIATMAMYKVPFGNSVEVGTEAIQTFFSTTENFINTLSLINLLIKNMIIMEENSQKILAQHLTMATYSVEKLVQDKDISFREAHHVVGEKIREALDNQQDALQAIQALVGNRDIDPQSAVFNMQYGGGLGSVKKQYESAVNQLNRDAQWLRERKKENR